MDRYSPKPVPAGRFASLPEASAHAQRLAASSGRIAWLVRLEPGWGVMTRAAAGHWPPADAVPEDGRTTAATTRTRAVRRRG